MEPLSIAAGAIGIMQTFSRALETAKELGSLSPSQRLLNEYTVLMGILQYCVPVVENHGHGGALSQTILYTADQCAKLGQELAYRSERVSGKNGKKRVVYALASDDKLLSLHTDFKFYVDTLHKLVQRLVLLYHRILCKSVSKLTRPCTACCCRTCRTDFRYPARVLLSPEIQRLP